MYYSIPEVLRASLNLEDVDYSDITGRSRSHADSDPSPSHPQQRQEQEAAVEDDASKVSRRSRISFERHPSVLMEDMLDYLDQEFGGDELLDLDDIISRLRRRSSSKRQ